jgi:cell division protein FtsL
LQAVLRVEKAMVLMMLAVAVALAVIELHQDLL